VNQWLRKRYSRVKTCNFLSKTSNLLFYNNYLLKNLNSETLVIRINTYMIETK
jgi:hypothetical protein